MRVLGKCGGFDSDILVGMQWAAGVYSAGELAGLGLPANATPAKVLNMSLGSTGACSAAYQSAMTRLTAAGVVVVASAGNTAGHAVSTPANCPGFIAVGGLRHVGTKVGFSDLGPQIAISAPGGNCVNIGASAAVPLSDHDDLELGFDDGPGAARSTPTASKPRRSARASRRRSWPARSR